MSREQLEGMRQGQQEFYDQASLLAGVGPAAAEGRAVTLASRRPLANPPPSRAPEPVVEQPSFTIYHGSPHLFAPTERNPLGEFDPTKIGTGEGEQAYGVGAGYGAENEGVARGYRKKLSGPAPGFTGEIAPELRAALKAEDYLGFDRPADAISAMETHPDWRQRWDVENPDALAAHFDAHQEAKYGGQGHMYEVNVNADPERFLHWDKPLSEQHPDVQSLLPKLPDGVTKLPTGRWATTLQGEVIGRPDGWPDMSTAQYVSQTMRQDLGDTSKWTGSDLHRHLVRQNPGNPAAPSEIMSQAGIPGIRYLDQGSRGAGEGSHNYVVFDANTMNIIRRYGLAGLMAGGGAAAAQQRQPNALQQQ
jgi:hypothetical protein